MRKFSASLTKELLLLLNDKSGLLIMYFMPLLLVFIITLVQDSAFKIVNENKLELLAVNHDTGIYGDSLINKLNRSGNFKIEKNNQIKQNIINITLLKNKKLLAIYIPNNFSKKIQNQGKKISSLMLKEFGLADSTFENTEEKNTLPELIYSPLLQENFRYSISVGIENTIKSIQNQCVLDQLFNDIGYSTIPYEIKKELDYEKSSLLIVNADLKNSNKIPNATQHNIPAWSLFAMFFMVISLGGNIVKERNSGSFVRLQTIPYAFLNAILSKVFVYVIVSMSQLYLLLIVGKFIFPLIQLQALEWPSDVLPFIVVSLLSAFSAISYSLLIGLYANTHEQSNGIGAISIIIFAAIGGILVPSFVMPNYLQQLGKISPLHWCIESYYTLFLYRGSWLELSSNLIALILFISICLFFIFKKLKSQNFI